MYLHFVNTQFWVLEKDLRSLHFDNEYIVACVEMDTVCDLLIFLVSLLLAHLGFV